MISTLLLFLGLSSAASARELREYSERQLGAYSDWAACSRYAEANWGRTSRSTEQPHGRESVCPVPSCGSIEALLSAAILARDGAQSDADRAVVARDVARADAESCKNELATSRTNCSTTLPGPIDFTGIIDTSLFPELPSCGSVTDPTGTVHTRECMEEIEYMDTRPGTNATELTVVDANSETVILRASYARVSNYLAKMRLDAASLNEIDNNSTVTVSISAVDPNGIAGSRPTAFATPKGYGITYHGVGPIISSAECTVYLVFYATTQTYWTSGIGLTKRQILETYIANMSPAASGAPSKWMNILSTYTDSKGLVSSQFITLGASTILTGTSTKLSDSNVRSLILGTTPKNVNALYLLITAAGITQGGSSSTAPCASYCGWHSYTNIQSVGTVKYGWTGDAGSSTTCMNACAPQTSSPNPDGGGGGGGGADGMISVISHEIVETITDPTLSTWYDTSGAENADKWCVYTRFSTHAVQEEGRRSRPPPAPPPPPRAPTPSAWTFGLTTTNGNGALSNVVLGNKSYLVQQNYYNRAPKGGCGMS